jgi:predicted Zn-dependent peptidase
LYNKVQPLADFFKAIESITSEDILRVSNEFISPEKMSHLVYLDRS